MCPDKMFAANLNPKETFLARYEINSIKTNKGRVSAKKRWQLTSEPYVIVSHHTARHIKTDLQSKRLNNTYEFNLCN